MTEDSTRPCEGDIPPGQPLLAQPAPPKRAADPTSSREHHREAARPTPTYKIRPYGPGDPYPFDYQPGGDWAPDIGKLFQTLWRHKWLTILCMAATAAGTLWYLRSAVPVYEAQALLELSTRRPRIMHQRGALIEDQGLVQAEALYNTQILKLRGTELRDRVARAMQTGGEDPGALAPWLQKVKIELVRRSTLVSVTTAHTDPALASRLANVYAREAVAHALDENKALSEEAVRWLRAQADAQRRELEDADRQLLRFRNEHSLNSLAAQQTMTRDSLLAVNAELTHAHTALTRHTQMLNHLQAITKGDDPTEPLPAATPGLAEIAGILNGLREQRAKRDALLRDYTPKHPSVVDSEAQTRTTLDALTCATARAVGTARSDVALLQDQADALRAKKDALAAELDDLEQRLRVAQCEQDDLERRQGASQISYQGVLTRIEEARLSADEQTATIKLAEEARLPDRPSRPRPLRLLAVAILLGGALGLGCVFVAHGLQGRVWTTDDIETADPNSPLRILGIIPRVEKKHQASLERISAEHKFDRVTESFLTLRGVLSAMECGSVIAVTGAGPGEGKTTCASNLAIGFARAGQHTLLLDMDMRRPRLARIWGIDKQESSLLHALAAEQMPDFASLRHATDVPGLDVIVSHRSTRISPSETIGQSRTRELIGWARKHYDRVVIDAPPVGIAADAMLLGGVAHSVLLVVRFNHTHKRTLGAAAAQLRDGKANILGVVVNDVVFDKFGYGYRHPMYRYYSGYREYSKYTAAFARDSRQEDA